MRGVAVLLLGMLATVGLVEPALAYIGPGAGLSMLGAFWGLLVAVVAALSFLLLWPVRRLLSRNSAAKSTMDDDEQGVKTHDQAVQR